MPLTPGQPAMMVARLGTMRLGASRLGYYEPVVTITINGVLLTGDAKALAVAGLTITYTRDGTPNTATLRVTGCTPVEGQEIRIGLGGLGRGQIIFAGHILQATQVYVGSAANLQYDLSCISYEWLLNDRPLTGKFLSTSATDIVLWIMSGATGFSTAGVEAGLPALDEITFTNVDRADALDRVAKRGGWAWVVDYRTPPRLHFGAAITPWSSAIHPITTADPHGMEALARTIDLSQVRTRVEVEGGGANTTAQVPAGTLTLPIEDPVWYDPNGGTVVSGPQRIDYSGTVEGGAGALVGTTLTPTNGPTVTPRATTGMTAGARSWAVTFGTAAGKTLPSPLTALTLGGAVAPPSSAPTVAKALGGSLSAGVYKWKLAYKTALGKTLASVASAALTMDDVAAPSAVGTVSDIGAAGDLTPGVGYRYQFTHRAGALETTPGPASNSVVVGTGGLRLTRAGNTAPPAGFDRQFYREKTTGGGYKRMPGDSDGFDADDFTYYFDTQADALLGVAPPSVNTAVYRSANLTGIPVSANPLVTHVTILRTEANGSVYKEEADIVNGTTSYLSTIADGSLGATELSVATALYLAADLTNISLGPTGTTFRDVWRTEGGGSQLKLLTTIANNTSTGPYTDTTADGSLGANIHTTDTSGLVAQSGDVPAGSASILVTALAPFQAGGGWAFIGTLPILYTGVSGTSLTGVPPTGPGALTTTVRYGSEVIAAHMLTGIPASGQGSIHYDIPAGEPVNLLVTRNDVAAQAVLAARLTTPTRTHDGIVVEPIQDRRLSQLECENRGDARLAEVSSPLVTLRYQTHDLTHRSGWDVTFALDAPTNITGPFKVQRVTLSQFEGGRSRPIRTVEASSRRLSFEAILRLVKGKAA